MDLHRFNYPKIDNYSSLKADYVTENGKCENGNYFGDSNTSFFFYSF